MRKNRLVISSLLLLFNVVSVYAGKYSDVDGLTAKGHEVVNTFLILAVVFLFVSLGVVSYVRKNDKKAFESDMGGCVWIVVIVGIILWFVVNCS